MSFKNDALLHKHQDCIDNIKEELKDTLDCEYESYENSDKSDDVLKGWIEGLEYALSVIDHKEYQSYKKEEK
tara:strand:- start:183 stop:398 length:216 start_codon:yes stop_codon:yes gene_type:complete